MKMSLRDRAAAGAAVVVSSHLLALVEDLCTHLLILHRGRRLFFGPVQEARTAVRGDRRRRVAGGRVLPTDRGRGIAPAPSPGRLRLKAVKRLTQRRRPLFLVPSPLAGEG